MPWKETDAMKERSSSLQSKKSEEFPPHLNSELCYLNS